MGGFVADPLILFAQSAPGPDPSARRVSRTKPGHRTLLLRLTAQRPLRANRVATGFRVDSCVRGYTRLRSFPISRIGDFRKEIAGDWWTPAPDRHVLARRLVGAAERRPMAPFMCPRPTITFPREARGAGRGDEASADGDRSRRLRRGGAGGGLIGDKPRMEREVDVFVSAYTSQRSFRILRAHAQILDPGLASMFAAIRP